MRILLLCALALCLLGSSCEERPTFVHMTMGHSYSTGLWNSGHLAGKTGCDEINPRSGCLLANQPLVPGCFSIPGTPAHFWVNQSPVWSAVIADMWDPENPETLVVHLKIGDLDHYFGRAPQDVADSVAGIVAIILDAHPRAVVLHVPANGLCVTPEPYLHLLPQWLLDDPRYELVEIPDEALTAGWTLDGCHPTAEAWQERMEILIEESRLLGNALCG